MYSDIKTPNVYNKNVTCQVSLLTNIASTIMFVGMIWVLVDKIDQNVVRVVVKVITAGFVGLLELAIFVDMTINKK